MALQALKPKSDLATYEICLINLHGVTVLVFETMCAGDEEAMAKLFAIQDVPYGRFEISCGDALISQGLRCNELESAMYAIFHFGRSNNSATQGSPETQPRVSNFLTRVH